MRAQRIIRTTTSMTIHFSVRLKIVIFLVEKNLVGALKTNGMDKIAEFQYHLGAFSNEKTKRDERLERIPNG